VNRWCSLSGKLILGRPQPTSANWVWNALDLESDWSLAFWWKIFCHWVIHQNSCFFFCMYKSVDINHWPHSCTPSPCVNAACNLSVPWCPGIATPRNRGSVGIYIHFLGPYNRGCLRLYNQLGRDYVRHVFSAVLIFLLFDLLVFLMQKCTHMPQCQSFSGVSFHFPCVPTSFSTPGYGSILLFLFCFPTQQRWR
jgi:hypothetical protein